MTHARPFMSLLALPVLLLCGVVPARGAHFAITTGELVVGQVTEITVKDSAGSPVSGAVVRAAYRPGSQVEHDTEIGLTDARGVLAWAPRWAGLVRITATEARAPNEAGEATRGSTTVAVRFRGVPARSILVLLVAGLILFGGIVWSYLQLAKPVPDPDQDPAESGEP